jgi:hypothetical protein
MVRAVLTLWISVFQSAVALFRSRRDQAIVEMALRQQLAIYARRHWLMLTRIRGLGDSLGRGRARRASQRVPAPRAVRIAGAQ